MIYEIISVDLINRVLYSEMSLCRICDFYMSSYWVLIQ